MKVKNENLEKLFMYKIVDDFLPSLLFKYYSDHVSHLNFPWFYTNNISTGNKSFLPDVPILNNFGFSSPAFADIDNPPAADGEATIFLFYPLLLMVQEECDGTEILRARFDMTTHTHSPSSLLISTQVNASRFKQCQHTYGWITNLQRGCNHCSSFLK